MKKLLLLLFLFLNCFSYAEADRLPAESIKSLVLTKHDSTEIVLLLKKKPLISFEHNTSQYAAYIMKIQTTGSTVTIPTSEVKSLVPSETELSGVTEILSPGNVGETSLDYLDGALLIETSHDAVTLEVYNIAGVRQLYQVLPQGKTVLRLDTLPKDFYIVKVGNQTLKIQKL